MMTVVKIRKRFTENLAAPGENQEQKKIPRDRESRYRKSINRRSGTHPGLQAEEISRAIDMGALGDDYNSLEEDSPRKGRFGTVGRGQMRKFKYEKNDNDDFDQEYDDRPGQPPKRRSKDAERPTRRREQMRETGDSEKSEDKSPEDGETNGDKERQKRRKNWDFSEETLMASDVFVRRISAQVGERELPRSEAGIFRCCF